MKNPHLEKEIVVRIRTLIFAAWLRSVSRIERLPEFEPPSRQDAKRERQEGERGFALRTVHVVKCELLATLNQKDYLDSPGCISCSWDALGTWRLGVLAVQIRERSVVERKARARALIVWRGSGLGSAAAAPELEVEPGREAVGARACGFSHGQRARAQLLAIGRLGHQ